MKVIWKEQFREDFKRLEKRLKNPKPFRKAFNKAISKLQTGTDLSKIYPVNKITSLGPGWYDCYFYSDIVMVYLIRGQCIILTAIGSPNEFLNR